MNKCFSQKRTLLAGVLSLAAFNASAAWTVNGTFCETFTNDGSVQVRIKPDNIGLIEMQPQCNGRGAFNLTGSNFIVDGTGFNSNALCNAQTNYKALQTTQTTKDIRSVIDTFKNANSVSLSTFGASFIIDTSDFAKNCASIIGKKVAEYDQQEAFRKDMERMGYYLGQDGQWHKRSRVATQ
ncbi:hypothetical protein D7I40_11035 [Citrobacter sp. MH181794]|nr:hypothetical protein D7I40_11035 [Citrobacter sp. MH181794]